MSSDSKDAVKLGKGLIGTMAVLVLGLLVASAKASKASYDAQGDQLVQLAANAILLDRIGHYGPETKEARDVLPGTYARCCEEILRRSRKARRLDGHRA